MEYIENLSAPYSALGLVPCSSVMYLQEWKTHVRVAADTSIAAKRPSASHSRLFHHFDASLAILLVS